MNKKKSLKFAQHFPKLNSLIFPTMRDESDLEEKEIVKIIAEGEPIGEAEVLSVERYKLKDIPTAFLLYDTDTRSREDAIEKMRRYYPDLKESDTVVILTLQWVFVQPPHTNMDELELKIEIHS